MGGSYAILRRFINSYYEIIAWRELENLWMETVATCFNVLSLHSLEQAEKIHDKTGIVNSSAEIRTKYLRTKAKSVTRFDQLARSVLKLIM
jgi:hypothetical protein